MAIRSANEAVRKDNWNALHDEADDDIAPDDIAHHQGLGFGVWGLDVGVLGLGFGIWGLG